MMHRIEAPRRAFRRAASWAFFLTLACSSKEPAEVSGGGTGGGAGAQGSGGSGVLPGGGSPAWPGGKRIDCTPTGDECPSGSSCSNAGFCVLDGYCGNAADCQDGQSCGGESAKCLNEFQCFADGDCAEGSSCDTELELCEIAAGCGATQVDATRVPPNLLIVMDRSGSMSNSLDGTNRWTLAKQAVSAVLENYGDSIRFGLATYSACLPGGCSAGTIVVPIGADQATAIEQYLAPRIGAGSSDGAQMDGDNIRYLCNSGTPETTTGKTLLSFVGEPSLQDTARANAVLLLTDGQESSQCRTVGVDDGPSGAAALLAQSEPVKTYVVGLSNDVTTQEIQGIADAGGTGVAIHANDQAALVAAFADIARSVVSCELVLDTAPPDPNKLFVFLDGSPKPLPRHDKDGWEYDAEKKLVTFVGTTCEKLKSGELTDVQIVYGCPTNVR